MSTNFTFQKPPIAASLLAASGICVLIGLGTWQFNKYMLKTNLPPQTAATSSAAPITDFNDLVPSPAPRPYHIQAHYDGTQPLPIGPRVHDGKPGYHIYAALRDTQGHKILANLGWSADKSPPLTTGPLHIEAFAVPAPRPNMFTPANAPEKNEWFWLDFSVLNSGKMDDLRDDAVLMVQSMEPEAITPFIPANLSKTYLAPETHLQYAAFWYFMAAAMATIFALRFVVKKT